MENEEASKQRHKEIEDSVDAQDPNAPENQKGARQRRGRELRKEIIGEIAKGTDQKEYAGLIQGLARELYGLGLREREQLIDGVYGVMQSIGSKMKRSEVRDAISGYVPSAKRTTFLDHYTIMNQSQKKVLLGAAAAIFAMLLFPPPGRNSYEYDWILSSGGNIDVRVLLVQWAGVVLIGAIMLLYFHDRR